MSDFWILAATFVFSLTMTGGMRRYALKVRLLDIPNRRSSHSVPVSWGGGLAVVLAYGYSWWMQPGPWHNVFCREKLHVAHRGHASQIFSRRWQSHRKSDPAGARGQHLLAFSAGCCIIPVSRWAAVCAGSYGRGRYRWTVASPQRATLPWPGSTR